jgi:chromosomal replication initiation ATPase DnaA
MAWIDESDAAHNPLRICTVVEGPVAQVFGVGKGDLFRATRGRAPVALARQVAMYLAHICCGLSFTEIGQLFGRDRTTVAHACAVVEDRRDDPIFDRTLELLEWVVPSLLFPRRPYSHWGA